MQALVDAAVMIVAMVIPALRREFLEEGLHFQNLIAACRWRETLATPPFAGRTVRQWGLTFAEANEREGPERGPRPALDQRPRPCARPNFRSAPTRTWSANPGLG